MISLFKKRLMTSGTLFFFSLACFSQCIKLLVFLFTRFHLSSKVLNSVFFLDDLIAALRNICKQLFAFCFTGLDFCFQTVQVLLKKVFLLLQ